MQARPKVLILGGGFAGTETATYLRWKAGDRVDITVVSAESEFLFRPNTIYIPFGLDVRKLKFPLGRALAKKQIEFIHGTATVVDPDAHTVEVQPAQGGSEQHSYDYLVIATGAGIVPEEVPGLAEHAYTPWTPDEMSRLGAGFNGLLEKAKRGERSKALFLIPPNNRCSGPLYELVFMFDTWLRRKKARDWVTISWTTSEKSYIQAFGPKTNEHVTPEFARRGIDAHTEWVVEHVEPDAVHYTNGEVMEYDLLATFPPYKGGREYPGLPTDPRGYLITDDLGTRRLKDHPEIFVPGDAGDFPVKQAFLAFLEADGVAAHLAQEVTGEAAGYAFDPISMCVMEQMDRALFAQVPLTLTGDPAAPVAIRPGSDAIYKIGEGRVWRLGKVALGYYLPFRFKAGEPFHAGAPWTAMETVLKGMAAVLAR